MLAQRWANAGAPPLDQLTNPRWANVGEPSLAHLKGWRWAKVAMLAGRGQRINQGLLHLWSKFGGPSLNGSWVIARKTSDWHTDGQTDAVHDNTRRPKLASGKNVFENVVCEMGAILSRSQCIKKWDRHKTTWSFIVKLNSSKTTK